MFLQQQVRFKLLHYISVVFACMADSDSDMPQATLLSVAAREANSRADATFAEMIGRGESDSADAAEIAAPAPVVPPNPLMPSTTEAEIDAPAPSDVPSALPSTTAAAPPSTSSAAPSALAHSIAAAASAVTPCPLSMLLPIDWDRVLYFTDATGTQRYDTKNSPLPLPHPNMEFRGYVQKPDGNVEVFFSDRTRRGHPGTRMPKPSGGVNKQYFDGLKAARTDEERATYRRENGHLYKSRKKRFGPLDPL